MSENNYVNINSLEIDETPMEGFDANANPLARTLIDDGDYVVSVEFKNPNPTERFIRRISKAGNEYYQTDLVLTVLEGPNAKRKIFDTLRTTVVGGTTDFAQYIKAMGQVPVDSAIGQLRQFDSLVPGKPVKVSTIWEGYNPITEKTEIKGQRFFPRTINTDGSYGAHRFENVEGAGGAILKVSVRRTRVTAA